MKIFGVSQSSGVERVLKLERGIDGIVVTIANHLGGGEVGRIKVNSDTFVGAILEPVVGGSIVEGMPEPQGPSKQLVIEVRHNEVWLQLQGESGVGADVAIGLDDLQDALEGVTKRE
jgi:hypothetical protein